MIVKSYHRRENIISTLIDSSSKVKDILKHQSKDLNEPTNKFLFREEFETKMLKDSKAIKKSESGTGSKRPFPGGSPFHWQRQGAVET